MANTTPVTDTAEAAERILDLGRACGLVDVQPIGAVTHDLAGGQLVRAADPSWDLTVDIRLYRSLSNARPVVEQFWNIVSTEEHGPAGVKPQLARC